MHLILQVKEKCLNKLWNHSFSMTLDNLNVLFVVFSKSENVNASQKIQKSCSQVNCFKIKSQWLNQTLRLVMAKSV